MSETATYPKRLIEVDLPIKRISVHARREKSIRHGHISTLHMWWARRPLAACRAVICAALWIDPADPLCPDSFREVARAQMRQWATDHLRLMSNESYNRFVEIQKKPELVLDNEVLQRALLDFIADFANWDNSANQEYLNVSHILTQAAHEALGGIPGTRPLVVDPFAGGGAIPLEALRVGADAFASDLNPVAVLLNKVVLEYIPRYGQQLADEVRKWGAWVKAEAEKELAEFYPKDPDGSMPIAYLWARTIVCEGVNCGAEVPLMRSLWLSKKASRPTALRIIPNREAKRVEFDIVHYENGKWTSAAKPHAQIETPKLDEATVRRGSATCPVCGFTTQVASVRRQLKAMRGGANDARLFCVVTTKLSEQGRNYRLPTDADLRAICKAKEALKNYSQLSDAGLNPIPDEPTPLSNGHRAVSSVVIYGMDFWADMFTSRQLLSLTTLTRLVHEAGDKIKAQHEDGFAPAVQTILGLGVSRLSDICNAFCRWEASKTQVRNLFGRQALPMLWDFAEPNILANAAGNFSVTLETMVDVLSRASVLKNGGHAEQASALLHPLPDDAAQAFITDPPYYDSVPYADLADFFYVWLKRTVGDVHPELFKEKLTPKSEQAIVWHPHSDEEKKEYERKMQQALNEGRRVLNPSGIGLVVFAHKSTAGWEAQLQAMVDAGWIVSGSWSIDTELGNRMNAMGTAALASSVHIVCRPRENLDGSVRVNDIGDWRDVLRELPIRIHEWMPRLAKEDVVGADAIFACLGPALEVFSRYSRVEKASGEQVLLKEYLEYVWAAVAKEALNMIFEGADTSDFEEDARLTAMWLWTLSTSINGNGSSGAVDDADADETDDEDGGKAAKSGGGFSLEYDAARKIAQGLGARLENLNTLVEVTGSTARLLPVSERAAYLFPKGQKQESVAKRGKKKAQQELFDVAAAVDEIEGGWGIGDAPKVGTTVLDRVHQSMILFGAGRGDALKTFLIDEGVANDQRFWRLAQAFAALYPAGTEERRWVEGVMGRLKGLVGIQGQPQR